MIQDMTCVSYVEVCLCSMQGGVTGSWNTEEEDSTDKYTFMLNYGEKSLTSARYWHTELVCARRKDGGNDVQGGLVRKGNKDVQGKQ